MKLRFACLHCLFAGLEKNEVVYNVSNLEVREEGWYEICCSQGHRHCVVLREVKFQVLFEIGVNAIADGYYREAVGSFAASLERFHEFAARVLALHTEIRDEEWRRAWKSLKSLSEREFGGFVLMWLGVLKAAPAVLAEDMVKIRNKVTHQGLIPTRELALRYGEAVRDVVEANLTALRAGCPKALKNSVAEYANHVHESIPAGRSQVGHSIHMTLSFDGDVIVPRQSLEQIVAHTKRQQESPSKDSVAE